MTLLIPITWLCFIKEYDGISYKQNVKNKPSRDRRMIRSNTDWIIGTRSHLLIFT